MENVDSKCTVLPSSWEWTKTCSIGGIVSGGTPSTKEPTYWGGKINWISPSDLTGYTNKFILKGSKSITAEGLQKSSAKLMPPGSIHFSTRAPIGYTVISISHISTNQGFKSLVPANGIFNEYVYYYFKSIKNLSESVATGTTFKELSGRAFSYLPFPLPPSKEQHRIVAKIEELFTELDNGIESLKTTQKQLRIYRQALLKHAFEGKLTEQWRKENADKLETPEKLLARIKKERKERYQEQLKEWQAAVKDWEKDGKDGKKPVKPRQPKTFVKLPNEIFNKLSRLPDSWFWEKLGWMTCAVEYGTSAKSSTRGSYPVLRMGNIQNFKFDWVDLVYTSNKEEITRYLLKDGDILFNRTNSPELVGKTAIYKSERPALFAGYLIRVNQFNNLIHPQYLNLFLNSHQAKQYGNKVKTDGVNQSNINGDKLANYPFPYCSFFEQTEIVKQLEEKISIIDSTEKEIEINLRNAEALRQSILKKAFSGKLVPQDPNDEPASVLLKKIKAEKARQTALSKPIKPTTKKSKEKVSQ